MVSEAKEQLSRPWAARGQLAMFTRTQYWKNV